MITIVHTYEIIHEKFRRKPSIEMFLITQNVGYKTRNIIPKDKPTKKIKSPHLKKKRSILLDV